MGIKMVVTQYFSDMFTAGSYDTTHMRVVVDLTLNCVTEEMNNDLIASYSGEEIRVALFQMHPNKSPGPDGLPPLFYQHYRDEIVLTLFRQFKISCRQVNCSKK